MIQKIREIPVTETSYPFASAERYLHLSEIGYEEKEYYMYGTANVYSTLPGGKYTVKNTDVPYVNRFIVRQPQKTEDFSGNVVIEILNATSGMDIDRMWINGYRQFIRSGDIYIGITSKHNTPLKLKEFDPQRYAEISWPNPTPDVPFEFTMEEYLASGVALGDLDLNCEPGLFWDMLIDLAKTLRTDSDTNPVAAYHPEYLVLTGWSQSGDYMIRFINDFTGEETQDAPLFDGYLLGGPPRTFVTPLNQYETVSTVPTIENTCIRKTSAPTIIFHTESENSGLGGTRVNRKCGNAPDFQVRQYDITGSSHDTQFSYVDYYQNDPDLIRINHLPAYNCKNSESNDYPLYHLFAAGYRNLFSWIRTGCAPAECELIPVNADGENEKDALGITKGGLRTCLLNYPTGAYYNYSDIELGGNPLFPDLDKEILFGHEEAYPAEMLKAMYGSLAHYRELVEKDTFEQVTKGFIVREDAQDLIEMAVRKARQRGLE
ncbi:MAG: hypothetical protein K6C06_06300 [Lachnospiraceae bacterium]|nr:hypothetical protein [Lachnospiraceae bacterium]